MKWLKLSKSWVILPVVFVILVGIYYIILCILNICRKFYENKYTAYQYNTYYVHHRSQSEKVLKYDS